MKCVLLPFASERSLAHNLPFAYDEDATMYLQVVPVYSTVVKHVNAPAVYCKIV